MSSRREFVNDGGSTQAVLMFSDPTARQRRRDEIFRLRRAGVTLKEIACRFGISIPRARELFEAERQRRV